MLELPWEEGSLFGSSGGGGAGGQGSGDSGAQGGRTPSAGSRAPAVLAPPGGWFDAPLASLDLETTGRDPQRDRILGVALFRQEPGDDPVTIVDTLVDPGADVVIPDEAAAVHGITRERLTAVEAPPLADVLVRVHEALTDLAAEHTGIVIYNAPFDWPFLAAELARLDPPRRLPACDLIDPLVLDRYVDRYRRGKRTLAAACEVYEVALEDAHDAGADALASLWVARAIGCRYPEVGGLDLTDLARLQEDAHRTWRDGFNAYLRRIGADRAPVTGAWPGVLA